MNGQLLATQAITRKASVAAPSLRRYARLVGVAAAAIAAGATVYAGFNGAQRTGEEIGSAAQMGMRAGASNEFGQPLYYTTRDASAGGSAGHSSAVPGTEAGNFTVCDGAGNCYNPVTGASMGSDATILGPNIPTPSTALRN